jgi:predicted nucleic acid-binding protein
MARRTYIDSGVLIAAYKGTEPTSEKALAIIRDESRSFVVSEALSLECVSAALKGTTPDKDQAEFCAKFIERNEGSPLTFTDWALGVFAKHFIQPMDLLHISVAVSAGAVEFVTTEKSTKPFFTIGAPLSVVSIDE